MKMTEVASIQARIASPPAGGGISRELALSILADETKPADLPGLPVSLRKPLAAKAQGPFDQGRPAYVGINVRPDVYCQISLFPGGSALIWIFQW